MEGTSQEHQSKVEVAQDIPVNCPHIISKSHFKLPQQDTEGLNIGRILHNYTGELARIIGTFEDGFKITVYLSEKHDLIYANYSGVIPKKSSNILGFIPPLGPVAEREEFLSLSHIRRNINTSLAPRHLRNHLAQVLSRDEYAMVQAIVSTSWPNIRLLDYEHHYEDNTLSCYFKEGRIEREIAWAGQGLQVWFQIITHLIRLRNTSVLVLDEPEINLHAEKQNDLIQVLKDHHIGSVIIATHSVELMNNVDVSHIVHVQKKANKPTIKHSKDRAYLDIVRSQVGSNFNLIASQFESVDLILFTEDRPYIPLSCWHETIRELDPLYVYMHRLNIVVVLKRKNEIEEGKYIRVSLSSYLPMTGDDGFVFNPNPLNGNEYTLGNGLFDFKRNIGKSPELQPTDSLGQPEGRP